MQRRAFTLIEVMVVVIIIGVLSAMILPNFGPQRDNAQLRAESERLLAAMRFAQTYATGHQIECRLLFKETDEDAIAYRVEIPDDDSESGYAPLSSMTVKPTTWPASIKLDAIDVYPGVDAGASRMDEGDGQGGGAGELNADGERAVFFYASGTADTALIRMANAYQVVSLVVEPNTGRAQIIRGRVEQAPNLREDLDAD